MSSNDHNTVPHIALADVDPAMIEDDALDQVASPDGEAGKIEGAQFGSNPVIEQALRTILAQIGEDPEREGLLRTPRRVARMYAELTAGYRVDPETLVNDAVFSVDYDEMVVVRDIDFYSLCEHHMLPFY